MRGKYSIPKRTPHVTGFLLLLFWHDNCYQSKLKGCRNYGGKGGGESVPPKILKDQLVLFQPGGQIMLTKLLLGSCCSKILAQDTCRYFFLIWWIRQGLDGWKCLFFCSDTSYLRPLNLVDTSVHTSSQQGNSSISQRGIGQYSLDIGEHLADVKYVKWTYSVSYLNSALLLVPSF